MTPERLAETREWVSTSLENLHRKLYKCPLGDGCILCDLWHQFDDLLTALRETQGEFIRLDTSHAMVVKQLVRVEREHDTLQQRVEGLEKACKSALESFEWILKQFSLTGFKDWSHPANTIRQIEAALRGGETG